MICAEGLIDNPVSRSTSGLIDRDPPRFDRSFNRGRKKRVDNPVLVEHDIEKSRWETVREEARRGAVVEARRGF